MNRQGVDDSLCDFMVHYVQPGEKSPCEIREALRPPGAFPSQSGPKFDKLRWWISSALVLEV